MQKNREQTAGFASPWSTGSGGPTFETAVGAYFMAAMLAGERVLEPFLSHLVTGIDWQTRDKGWLLEDLLLSLRDGTSEGSLALSAKSNHQINRAGFAEDFVQAIWTHWRRQDTDVFDKTRDFLGLAVGRLTTRSRTPGTISSRMQPVEATIPSASHGGSPGLGGVRTSSHDGFS